MKCLVPDCQGYGTIFGIPPNKSLREKWQKALPFNITLKPNSNQGICVKHFRPRFITCNPLKDGSGKELFHTYLGNTRRLVDNAVPTLFSKHLRLEKKRPLLKADEYGGDESTSSISKKPKEVFHPPPLISLSGARNNEVSKDGNVENTSMPLQPPQILLQVVSSSELQCKDSNNDKLSTTSLQKPKKILFQVPPFISKTDGLGKRDSILVSRSKCNSSNSEPSGNFTQGSSCNVALENNCFLETKKYVKIEPKPIEVTSDQLKISQKPPHLFSNFVKIAPKPMLQNSPIVQLYDPRKKKIVVLKKLNNPSQNIKSPLGQRIDPSSAKDENDTHPNNKSASQKVPSIIQRSLLKRSNLCSKLDLKSRNNNCMKEVTMPLKSPKITLKTELPQRKNVIINTSKSSQLLASNAPERVNKVNLPTEDSSSTLPSQLGTLSSTEIVNEEKAPPNAASPPSIYSSSPEDNKFTHMVSSVTSPRTSETTTSITCHNIANTSGNEVAKNAELTNNSSSSSKIGKRCNEADVKSNLQSRLKKKVCVIPVKEVLNLSLTKVRVRELIAEQFGLRVPYGSKLFKVFSYNLKKFKNNYKKRMYYRERTKNSLRRQRNNLDTLAKTPSSIPINQSDVLGNKSLQENLEAKKSDLTAKKNIFEDSLMIDSSYRKRKYKNLEMSSAKQRNKAVKRTIPEKFRIDFLGEVRNGKGNTNCSGGLKRLYNIPTTITNINEKSQLEVLCQTLIEALHRLQESETEGSQLNLIVSIKKGDVSPESHSNSYDIAETHLKNTNESHISDNLNVNCNASGVNEVGSIEPPHALSYIVSNITSDIGGEGTDAMKEKVVNEQLPLVNESDIQLQESLSLAVTSGDNTQKEVMMNSDCNSCSEPTAVQMDIRHDHSYSPAMCFAFKDPRFLVKILENNAEGKKEYKAKLLMKPQSKKLIQKHENEKLKLQKRIYKLSMKIKTKNYHISEKNKKIKYLSNIICQQKGVKRIRFPKTLDEKLKKPEDFSENDTIIDATSTQQNNFYSNTEIGDSEVGNENTYIAETEAPLALTDEVSFTEESFDRRFNQLYQSLAEIATSDN